MFPHFGQYRFSTKCKRWAVLPRKRNRWRMESKRGNLPKGYSSIGSPREGNHQRDIESNQARPHLSVKGSRSHRQVGTGYLTQVFDGLSSSIASCSDGYAARRSWRRRRRLASSFQLAEFVLVETRVQGRISQFGIDTGVCVGCCGTGDGRSTLCFNGSDYSVCESIEAAWVRRILLLGQQLDTLKKLGKGDLAFCLIFDLRGRRQRKVRNVISGLITRKWLGMTM